MRMIYCCLAFAALAGTAVAAEKKLQVKDLPPAVRKTVEEQTGNAQIKGISKETEKGKIQYEVESTVGGKARDFMVDAQGKLGDVEVETALASLPPAAKAAIEKKAAGGKLGRVETLTRDGSTYYEAAYTKAGKSHEVTVKADGSELK